MNHFFLKHAIEMAQKGLGHTLPNPAVGAVVVKENKIVARGWHKKAGERHAEIVAMDEARAAGIDLKGATVYITLEPCRHHGRTPPCTDRIVQEGIARVFVGMRDPFDRVNGRGMAVLKEKGIDVQSLKKDTPLYREVADLNQPFIKWANMSLPYVTMKAACTLDGKIATRAGSSAWITGEQARSDARRERSMCDAVLVGSGTVRADDPELAAHGEYTGKPLLRVIIDPSLTLPKTMKVFRDVNVLVATTGRALEQAGQAYADRGIETRAFGATRVSIKQLLQYLGQRSIQHVFVEGGAGVHGSVFEEALLDPLIVDRVLWYMAPMLFGGKSALSAIGGTGVESVPSAFRIPHMDVTHLGVDFKLSGRINVY